MPYKDAEKLIEHNRKYRKEHIKQTREYNKEYQKKYPEKRRKYNKKWREKNRERERIRYKEYHKKHPEKARERKRKTRMTTKGQIDSRMGLYVWRVLKETKAGRKWESLVGYTAEQLKQHLQRLFTKGMTWERFMAGEIHIDHVVPRSHFKYTSSEDPQFKECWALHNLQPLWKKDNLSKSNRNYQLPLILKEEKCKK